MKLFEIKVIFCVGGQGDSYKNVLKSAKKVILSNKNSVLW